MLLRLFIGILIFLLLRWLFFKIYNEYLKHKFEKASKTSKSQPSTLDELDQKAEANLKEREQIRGVTDQTQEKITNIKSKIE